jgi:hypothetical protein
LAYSLSVSFDVPSGESHKVSSSSSNNLHSKAWSSLVRLTRKELDIYGWKLWERLTVGVGIVVYGG